MNTRISSEGFLEGRKEVFRKEKDMHINGIGWDHCTFLPYQPTGRSIMRGKKKKKKKKERK